MIMYFITLTSVVQCCILSKLQKGLDDYVMWGRSNNMHLNVSKTKAMLIAPTVQYNLNRPSMLCGRIFQRYKDMLTIELLC